ncbi:triosephosphate isomerase [Herbaspirillum sp. 1173]|jgi:triosephosphate isomerase (EC 5.3.1.1)|uniref:triose-phosphate isomerase n=1 Tax=Herbaspirillum TaxID=963 RepID=UPI0003F53483|nr:MULTISPECIES: triose-phosphate isomerase [Herbaspirillum]MBN9359161.1 triose-phosphate isomerase [Herbaspirillum huttiense]MDR6742321.1 triosephosphate isomerase [Herbaspirillum sp. 1173]
MRRKLVAGNWKMNGSLAANAALVAGIKEGLPADACDVAVCVPAPYLAQVQGAVAGSAVALGAQDMSAHASGAFTGEVSAAMLQEFGVQYVILGHSERRAYHGESDAAVAAKTVAALKAGLVPVVCVGETLEQREAGQTNEIVGGQLDVVLAALSVEEAARIVVAYEPVWAIGTGKTATPEMAQEVHAMLRARLGAKSAEAAAKVRVLYGGSMKPDNAEQLLAMADIDGGLIGGAALKAADFLAIIKAAA